MLAGYASSTCPCAASCGLALRAGTATTTGSTAGLAKRRTSYTGYWAPLPCTVRVSYDTLYVP